MPDKSIYESPRLKKLKDDLSSEQAAKPEILNEFWDEVKAKDIPYFEPYLSERPDSSDADYLLATFLYEGNEDTKSVNLGAGFMARMDENPDNWRMQVLPETNVWYWTEKIRNDLRTTYFLTPNFLPPTDMSTPEKRHAFLKSICLSDPLNKKTFQRSFYPFQLNGANERVLQSVIEAPNASAKPYISKREGQAAGEVQEHRLKSRHYDYEHIFWVYTPPAYDSQRATPYPFAFLFDGFLYLDALQVPTILDNLIAEGKIPPLVCIMFNSEAENRIEELSPNEVFYQAMTDDWLPFLHDQYHLSKNPQDNLIGGMSLGGLGAAWNALKNPQIFGKVLSQSGSFWWHPSAKNPDLKSTDELEQGWLIRQFIEAEKLDLDFYLDVGLYETDGEAWTHRSLNRHMRDVLRAKGYSVHYQEYAGFHDHLWWQITLADGLSLLYRH
jgi:enterochelin esterase-like enzyme